MPNYEALLHLQKRKLQKALAHLEYSYNKILSLTTESANLDNETLINI